MTQIISAPMDEPLNLLVTIDRKYIAPLLVMLDSYGKTHRRITTHLYIAHSALKEEDLARIRLTAAPYAIEVRDIRVTGKWFQDTPVLERLPEESFYRLMAFDYLPQEVSRCLYLDPDIIIRRSLLPLYTTELDGYYLAAASHTYNTRNAINLLRLEVPNHARYINSGVMLMNIAAIRQDFTPQTILDCLNRHIRQLLMGDQDLINLLFGSRTRVVDERIWNLDERTFRHYRKSFGLDAVSGQTAIIHYNGKYKPWLNGYKGALNVFYPPVAKKGPAPKGKWKAQINAIRAIFQLTSKEKLCIVGILALVVACAFCWVLFGKALLRVLDDPAAFRAWLNRYGAFDELMFILIRAVQTVIKFIPAEPLEIGAGYVWGAVPGMLYCMIGNMIGTLAIFALTRRWRDSRIGRLFTVKKQDTLWLLRRSENLYILLFVLYLIPGSPKDGFTWLTGLLPVKLLPFLVVTFIARIPAVLSSTLCGSAFAAKYYLFAALIFALTIVLTLLGKRFYRSHTSRKIQTAHLA